MIINALQLIASVVLPLSLVASLAKPMPLQTFLAQNGGYLAWNTISSSRPIDFSYQTAEFNYNGKHFISFLRFDKKTNLVQEIDELVLPPLSQGRLETEFCKINSVFDPELIAWYAKPNPSDSYLKNPDKAWRANRKSEKIEVINNKKLIVCRRSTES